MASRRFGSAARVSLFLAAGGRRRLDAGEPQLDDGLEFLRSELAKLSEAHPEEAERLRIPASVEAIVDGLAAATDER